MRGAKKYIRGSGQRGTVHTRAESIEREAGGSELGPLHARPIRRALGRREDDCRRLGRAAVPNAGWVDARTAARARPVDPGTVSCGFCGRRKGRRGRTWRRAVVLGTPGGRRLVDGHADGAGVQSAPSPERRAPRARARRVRGADTVRARGRSRGGGVLCDIADGVACAGITRSVRRVGGGGDVGPSR